MGGHGCHEPPYRVPCHTEYCSIKGIPELVELETELAKKGLKDPWIRNEIWRYNKGFGTQMERFRLVVFRGFGIGFGLAAVTFAATKLFMKPDCHHAEEGEHGHSKE